MNHQTKIRDELDEVGTRSLAGQSVSPRPYKGTRTELTPAGGWTSTSSEQDQGRGRGLVYGHAYGAVLRVTVPPALAAQVADAIIGYCTAKLLEERGAVAGSPAFRAGPLLEFADQLRRQSSDLAHLRAVSASGQLSGPGGGGPVTVEQAATALHVSERTVRRQCRAGTLPARQLGGRWLIYAEAITCPD